MRGQRAAGIITRGVADAATAWERTFHFKQPASDAKAAYENIRARLLSAPPAPTAPIWYCAISASVNAVSIRPARAYRAAERN